MLQFLFCSDILVQFFFSFLFSAAVHRNNRKTCTTMSHWSVKNCIFFYFLLFSVGFHSFFVCRIRSFCIFYRFRFKYIFGHSKPIYINKRPEQFIYFCFGKMTETRKHSNKKRQNRQLSKVFWYDFKFRKKKKTIQRYISYRINIVNKIGIFLFRFRSFSIPFDSILLLLKWLKTIFDCSAGSIDNEMKKKKWFCFLSHRVSSEMKIIQLIFCMNENQIINFCLPFCCTLFYDFPSFHFILKCEQ